MRPPLTLSAVLVGTLGVVLSACNPSGGGAGKKVSLDDFPEAFAEAACARTWECCSDEEIANTQGVPYESEDECRRSYEGVFEAFNLATLKRSEREGRAQWDPRVAGDCIREIEDAPCDEIDVEAALGDMCPGIMEPNVPLGETCGLSLECVEGACVVDDFENETGSCVELPGEGEECYEYETPTGTEERCRTGNRCHDGVCVRPAAPGAECSDDVQCETDCEGGTCTERLGVGERCFDDDDCQSRNCDADDRCAEATGGECRLI